MFGGSHAVRAIRITVKVAELDVPPPGAALKTVIVRVPNTQYVVIGDLGP